MSKELFHQQRYGGIYASSDSEWEGDKATHDQLATIESLLHSSTLDQHQRQYVESRMMIMSQSEADEMIRSLGLNQQMTDKQLFRRLAIKPPF